MREGVFRFHYVIGIIRAHGGGETWRSAVKRENDFPVHVDSRIVIVIRFGRGYAKAHEDDWSLKVVLRVSHVAD